MARTQLANAQRLYRAGDYADAERACRDALKAKPGDTQATRLLGQIIRHTGKASESVQIFQRLGQARPNDLQLLGELGASLVEANQPDRALPLLRKAVQAMPASAEWKTWLGRCYLKRFDTPAALAVLREAHAAAPDNFDTALQLANALLLLAEHREAEKVARTLLEQRPGSIPAMLMLANAFEHQNRLDEQIEILEQALALQPDSARVLGNLAKCLRAKGELDKAAALLEPLADRQLTPETALALGHVYRHQKRYEECKSLYERALALEPLPVPIRASLNFSLGHILRQLGRHDEAFDAFRRANDAYPRVFSREHKLKMYDDIRATLDADTMRHGPRASIDASRCVFIVGMPRSGTSLVEQVLDAHPLVHGGGELLDLQHAVAHACADSGGLGPRCLESLTAEALTRGGRHYLDAIARLAPDAARVTDKMPHNFEVLGVIERMLPGARIIHCTRNPVDNCVSLYFTQLNAFHGYSNNLDDLGWAYARYRELMRHWEAVCTIPILHVAYEDMVADIETEAHRILEFIGLEWDDRCLRFYETDHAVTTASVEQVRQPIYTSSVARWKRYERHLTPLLDSLRQHGVDLPET